MDAEGGKDEGESGTAPLIECCSGGSELGLLLEQVEKDRNNVLEGTASDERRGRCRPGSEGCNVGA